MVAVDDFESTFNNLKDIYNFSEPYGNVEMAGIVGLFKVCFEQSWKAMKEILENNGFDESKTGSPRAILKTAYQAKMIQNEEMWLDALVSRNNVAHSYNKDIALDIIDKTKKHYYSLFDELKKEIDKNWV